MKLSIYLFIVAIMVAIAVVLRLTVTQEPELLLYKIPIYLTTYLAFGLLVKYRTFEAMATSCLAVLFIESIDIIWGDGQLFRIIIIVAYCSLAFLSYKNAVQPLTWRR